MIKKLGKASALDLEIKGSVGTFEVRQLGDDARSITVRFVQSHVRLATDGDQQEKLLEALSPVREVFATEQLDFEQIMQRDIDDARVSTQLIPYLLDTASSGMVKLFPPIVVVVLPVKSDGLPAEYYDSVEEVAEADPELEADVLRLRSGDVGKEIFEIRQVVGEEGPWEHDYATLRLNTHRSALVIVDGQHRAMGLIALYRNIKGWPADAMNVAPYYSLWSKEVIEGYDLTEAKLPVMFCVFPDLDGQDPSLPHVYEACRAIFLALNKNARKVTRARTWLLDDSDLISELLRDCLTAVKGGSAGAGTSLRLWNVELDAEEDRAALQSPIAVTGVNHLYGLLERLMFGSFDSSRLTVTRQNLWLVTRLDYPISRLGLKDEIPNEIQESARRRSIGVDHSEATSTIVQRFRTRMGVPIVRALSGFAPYKANNLAALEHHDSLLGKDGEFIRTIMYEGQSQASTFRNFFDSLTPEFKDEVPYVPGERFADIEREFKVRDQDLKAERRIFADLRLRRWLGPSLKKWADNATVASELNSTFGTLVSAAFQNALVLTFFHAIFEINDGRRSASPPQDEMEDDAIQELFDEYLLAVNDFFDLSSEVKLKNFIRVFAGTIEGTAATGTVTKSTTLRNVLIPGELKPEEWPKFRMILVELWKSSSDELTGYIDKSRASLRRTALNNFRNRQLKEARAIFASQGEELSADEVVKVEALCVSTVLTGLQALGHKSLKAGDLESLLKADDSAVGSDDAEGDLDTPDNLEGTSD